MSIHLLRRSLGAFRAVACALLLCLIISNLAGPARAAVGDPADPSRIDALKLSLDGAEASLKRDEVGSAELAELRRSVSADRDALQALVDALTPRVAEADARLKELGPAPAKDAPPEGAALAQERETLSTDFGNLDGSLKQAKALMLRADQLVERITEQRRVQYANRLFERSAGALAPSLWVDAAGALPQEMHRFGDLMRQWAQAVRQKNWTVVAAAWFGVFVLVVGAWLLSRRLRGHHDGQDAHAATLSRFRRARAATWVFLSRALLTALVAILIAAGLNGLGLLSPPQVGDLALAVVIGFVVAALGHGIADALAAPEAPERRLIRLGDPAAGQLHTFVVWSARALGTAIVLQAVHKTLLAPLALTIATTVLFGVAIALLLVRLASSWPQVDPEEADKTATVTRRFGWVRPLAWLLACVIGVALVAGYAGLAAFLALRVLAAVAILGILYLLLMLIEAVFNEALDPESPRGRSLAAALGLPVRNIRLVATLIIALVRVVLLACALALIIGPWEASTADMFASLQTVQLGFQIGEIRISLRTVLSGVAVLVVVLVITRVVQRWLARRLLPLTSIEPSLQLSIATMFGYAGVIAAIAFMLGAIGIDLQKIAFVAGALSVGIGFGLQSIVSNFVSGLILLAERPIRVGDSISVKGEEGWVRRIRVRATEIETFERASVIIPNSELITGLVKNRTHLNTQGRIIIKASVGYNVDGEQVRELLQSIASAHPQVMKTPPPRAFLSEFGANSLDFELRCVIANVENAMAVKSDLHLAVLQKFRAAGIEISPPAQAAENRMRPGPGEASAGAAGPKPAA